MAYRVRVGSRELPVLQGNLHMHTTWSDGNKSHQELARIAEGVGLDFIIVTDHNVYKPGLDAWVGDTLLLVGEEVHDATRNPQVDHLLCFGIEKDVAALADNPQALINAVNEQGGLAFLAHPFEKESIDFVHEPAIPWIDWSVTGFAGIELWNYMSEFKSVFHNRFQAILYAFFPALGIRGPNPQTLKKWDELLRDQRVVVIGGSDAHGTRYSMGPLSRIVHPYAYLFRCVGTHLLIGEQISGEVEHDRALILDALGQGRGFVSYERLGASQGFKFWAVSDDKEATMGESLSIKGVLRLEIETPLESKLRLLRDGQVVAETTGRVLSVLTHRAGVYRAEVYRRFAGAWRSWVFANPIYVR